MATLISHYDASQSSGSTFTDTVGGFNMTLQGGASFGTFQGRTAMILANNGDFARLATTDATQRISLPVSIACTFWATSGTGGNLFVTDAWQPSTLYRGIALQLDLPNLWPLVSYGDGGNGGSGDRRSGNSANSSISLNTWHTVICVLRGATDMTICIDGVDQGALTYSGSGGALAYGTGPMDAGVRNDLNPTQSIIGGITDCWLWSGETSCAELTQILRGQRRYIPGRQTRGTP